MKTKNSSNKIAAVAFAAAIILFMIAAIAIQPSGSPITANALDAEGIAAAISTYNSTDGGAGDLTATVNGNTVTVTGQRTGATTGLNISGISPGITIIWKANLEGLSSDALIYLQGSGFTFEVSEQGSSVNGGSGNALSNYGAMSTLNVKDDALLSSVGGGAVMTAAANCTVNMTGGTIITGRVNGDALYCTSAATINITGGTLSNTNTSIMSRGTAINASGKIYIGGDAVLSKAGYYYGEASTLSLGYYSDTTLVIDGGEFKTAAGTSDSISFNAYNVSRKCEIYLLGGSIQMGGSAQGGIVVGTATATAYYVGDCASTFGSYFTEGVNLFKMDGATVTADGAPHDGETPTYDKVIASLSSKLSLSEADVTVSGFTADEPIINTVDNFVSFTGDTGGKNIASITVTDASFTTLLGETFPISFTTADFGVNMLTRSVSYTAAEAGGAEGVSSTTGILVTFDADVSGLTADSITVVGADINSVTDNGDSGKTTWLINIGNITVNNGENITVEITDFDNFIVTTAGEQNVAIYRAPLSGTAEIDNMNPIIGDTLTGSLVGGNDTGALTFTWKSGTDTLQSGANAEYTVQTSDFDKEITLEITSSAETGNITSAASAAVIKAAQTVIPAAPSAASKTCVNITLQTISGAEYKLENGGWQDSAVFSGLTPNTEYTLYVRLKETATRYASDASSAQITTLEHTFTRQFVDASTLHSAATCTTAATYYYSCENCDEISNTLYFTHGAPLGHTFTRELITPSALRSAATCAAAATYWYSCENCNEISNTLYFTYGEPLEHTWVKTGETPATCTSDAIWHYECSVCHETKDEVQNGTAMEHTFTREYVDQSALCSAATCTEAATYWYSCENCNETSNTLYFIHGETLGHDYGLWTVVTEPTESTTGALMRVCLHDSNHTENSVLPILAAGGGYTYTVTSAPAEDTDGEGKYSYLKDGQTFEFTVVLAALDHVHIFGDWEITLAPTFNETGTLMRTCTVNSAHKDYFALPAFNTTDYAYSVITPPSCTAAGLGRYVYTKDGLNFPFNAVIPALGHDDGEWITVTEPTCTEEGLKELRCTECGEVLDTEIIPAGHDYGAWTVGTAPSKSAAGTLVRVCSHDAEHTDSFTLPALNKTDYVYTVVKAATAAENGEGKYTYSKDGQNFEFSEVIPALGEEVTPPAPEDENNPPKGGLSGGAIAGIAIGGVFVLSLGGFAIFWFVIKKKKFSDLVAAIKKGLGKLKKE